MFEKRSIRTLVAKEAYRRPEDRDIRLNGKYVMLPMYNKKNICAYRNNDTGKIYVGVAGTNPKSIKDLTTDLSLAINELKLTRRYREIEDVFKKIVIHYPTTKIDVSGHSLGGTSVAHLVKEYEMKHARLYGETYNAGSSPFALYPRSTNIKNYRTSNDFVSRFIRNAEIVSGDGHGLKNFTGE